jgi:hypothetical protein
MVFEYLFDIKIYWIVKKKCAACFFYVEVLYYILNLISFRYVQFIFLYKILKKKKIYRSLETK